MRMYFLALAMVLTLTTTAHAQVPGWTSVLQHPVQGTQIMYFGPSGKAYLWSTRSAQVEEGRYYLGMIEFTICFKFGADRYNPVTGLPAGRSECTSRLQLADLVTEKVEGDVFNLVAGGAVPFALGGSTLTLDRAARKAGIQLASPVINSEDLRVRPGEQIKINVEEMCKLFSEFEDYPYGACAR